MRTMKKVLMGLMLLAPACLQADVRLPKIFTDKMVLQQELPIAIFGWAEPGEAVTVKLNGQNVSATTASDGRWRVNLPAMKADGKPHVLRVQGKNVIELKDVLLGEVWLASGQSNMSRGLRFVKARALKEPMNHPGLRLFVVDGNGGLFPQREDIGAGKGWAEASHESMTRVFVHPKPEIGPYEFSEVTYFFGKKLQETLKVPVGMIATACPGTLVKEWTPVADAESKFDFQKPGQRGDGALYQSALHGLPPFTIRGAIWYQGENDARNDRYDRDLKTMIEAWRSKFERPDMPFYMAQIGQTTFLGGMLRIWECQSWVQENVPNTGLASSNDLLDHGDASKIRLDAATGMPMVGGGDPHPPNKNIIAGRMADIALSKTYGVIKHEVLGPQYVSHAAANGKIVVTLKHIGSGLKTDDGKNPNWFEIAAGMKDGSVKFVKAHAKITSPSTIEVWAEDVPNPEYVRFAWHPLARHNLYNVEGVPAISFRSNRPAAK